MSRLCAPGRSRNRPAPSGTAAAPGRTVINQNDLAGLGYTTFAGDGSRCESHPADHRDQAPDQPHRWPVIRSGCGWLR